MEKTFSVISLGCFRNTYDSEIIIPEFLNRGYNFLHPRFLSPDRKNRVKAVDLLIINTCGFIDRAKEESLRVISDAVDLKKKGRVEKIMVIGCLVKRYRRQLEKSYPAVDSWRNLVEFTPNFIKRDKLLSSPAVGFLKICEGCLNRCSFCAIPLIKGPLKSKFKAEVVKEAEDLEKKGVRELNIIGQDITSWGKDLKAQGSLPGLLKDILKASGKIKWLRLIYTHPKHFDDALIELIAANKKICKYIDLPIQHINDRILGLMNRGFTRQDTLNLIRKIRERIPGCVIRSSVIVGFPGETEREFKELLDFLSWVKFDRLGAFIYSREENTKAYRFSPQIRERTKQRRFKAVMEQQKAIANKLNRRFINQELEVLIEDKCSGGFIGRSQYDAPEVDGAVFLEAKGLKAGNFYKVKVVDCLDYDLVAEPVKI